MIASRSWRLKASRKPLSVSRVTSLAIGKLLLMEDLIATLAYPPNGCELSGAARLHRTSNRAEAASAPASCSGALRLLARAIEADLSLLESGKPLGNPWLDRLEKCLEFLAGVDQLHHNGKVLRKSKDHGGVDAAAEAVSHQSAQDRGAGDLHLSGLSYQPFVQGPPILMLALSDEYPEERAFFW